MPRPPILPVLDWEGIFEKGRNYPTWLSEVENANNVEKMETKRNSIDLEPKAEEFLKNLSVPVYVIAIAEGWCGDVVRHVPALEKIALKCENLQTKYIYREEAKEVFIRFLTNGGEAIPKFVFLSKDFVECGSWGPMSSSCREWIARGKVAGNLGAARVKVGENYKSDSHRKEVISELIELIDIASTTEIT